MMSHSKKIVVKKNSSITNSFNLTCEAAEHLFVKDYYELGDALAKASMGKTPIIPIGEASNVILPAEWQCLCIQLGMEDIEVEEQGDEVLLRVGAGKNWHALVTDCVKRGFHGLENLALIPGKVGAAPIQNIGAYGTEIQDLLVSVEIVEIETGSNYIVDAVNCGFGYRTSKFKNEWRDKFIITHINLKLHKHAKVNIKYASLQEWLGDKHTGDVSPQDVFNAVVALRKKILPDPQVNGNVGSFFHNPVISAEQFANINDKYKDIKGYKLDDDKVRVAAASLLDVLGFKGYQKNSLGMSPQHALCMINLGGATQADVLALASEIQEKVAEAMSVKLNIEPRIYF